MDIYALGMIVTGATLESAVGLLSSSVIPASTFVLLLYPPALGPISLTRRVVCITLAAGFLYEFLMTYRSFTTPAGLFMLLKKRLTPEDVQGSDLALVRLRVVNIFKNWINHCPQDWEGQELPSLFEGVLSTAQEDAVLLKHLDPLRQLIARIRETATVAPRASVPKITLPLYRVQNQLKSTCCKQKKKKKKRGLGSFGFGSLSHFLGTFLPFYPLNTTH
jgi:hypothetical protein